MTDTTTDTEEQPTDATEESAEETNPEGQAPGEGEDTPASDTESDEEPAGEPAEGEADEESTLDLEGALKALSKVRKEAASSRTKLRDLEQKLDGAKTPEEFQAAIDEFKEQSAIEARTLLVENVALKFNLPEDLADALRGDTREDLETHAKKLAKYAPSEGTSDPDLGGGLDPTTDPDGSFDPVAYAAQMRKKRWSR